MKTTLKKNLLRYTLFALAIVFALLLVAPFAKPKTASAGNVYENAFVGDVIMAEEYEITHNGEKVRAESLTVVYPSGGVYGGNKFTMSQAGKYAVTYHATVDGNAVKETCLYMAVRMPQDVVVVEDGMQVAYGKYEVESPYTMTKDTYGAVVTLKAGQTIAFSTNVKTSKLTADYNILDLIVMPSVFRETDFEKLTIRISDVGNEDNYVDVVVLSSNLLDGDGQVSYVQAGAKGQQLGGYEGSTFHLASLNYGTQIEHSFRAFGRKGDYRSNYTISENSLTVAIDNEERKVYCGPYSNSSDVKLMVNDLDDVANYKGNAWGGFTSDEVKVTVTADRFVKGTGKVVIKSLGDFDFSGEIQDTVAPEVLVDYDASKEMPVAEVGKAFPIFPFVAKDALDAQLNASVLVYYLTDNGQKITVENDGKSFFVKYAGNYQIVYRAEDYSGNVTEKTLEINAEDVVPNIYVGIQQSLVEVGAYQTVTIPLASQMSVFGGSGYLSVERAVYDPNNKLLDVKDSLQLTLLGDYKAIYTVTDYLGNVEYGVMTIRSSPVEKPSFIEKPNFDSVLIKGFTYELPQSFVIETNNGEIQEVACKVYVNGQLVEDSFKADGEEVSIRYLAEGVTGSSEWTDTISVVDTEYGKYKSRYFHTEGEVEIRDEKGYIELLFADECGAQFITPLYSEGFGLTISYDQAMSNFTSMHFVLTDVNNRNNTVTVKFFFNKDENSWFMQLNDSAIKLSYVTSKDIFTFALSKDTKRIIDTSGVEIATINSYDNGKEFQGFGDTLYWSIVFEDVKEESTLRLTQICNQSLGYNKSSIEKALDEIKPVIFLDAPFQMRQKLGSKAYIPTAKAYDVLGQVVEFTINVEMVGGELLASGPATELLDFTLEKPGYYLITYYAKDSNGNRESIPYTILVNDETAPTLTVKNNLKAEYKVGSKIKVPTYSAKDNGENCYIQVSLILPNNEIRLLHYSENGELTSFLTKENELYESAFKVDKNTFVALYKGKYTLRILAYDEYYNTTVKEIEFIVK